MATNPVLMTDLPFDTIKDFAPVSLTHLTPEELAKFLQSEMTRWRAVLAKKS
jgi:hypothetical protein